LFHYQQSELHCEQVRLAWLVAACGTPAYVYSSAAILERFLAYRQAFETAGQPGLVCYAVKANSNLAVLALLARAGAGFDIVSGGELYRVLAAGGDPAKVVFSGVGKTPDEIEYALAQGIHSFNCESADELRLLSAAAVRMGKWARVALRVNPDVDAATHPYISTGLRENKFGVAIEAAGEVYDLAASLPGLRAEVVSCHIGSQMLDPGPMFEALSKMLALVGRLRGRGHRIEELDFGGGLGVPYHPTDQRPGIAEVMDGICRRVRGTGLALSVEPGRSIVAEAGALLTRVQFTKDNGAKRFLVVDAAMNDLIRPSLYNAHHEMLPLRESAADAPARVVDVVGPVCESGDFLAKDRALPELAQGELLAILCAGAYGFVQASNYNSRPRPVEILVEGAEWRVVRERETYADLIRGERIDPEMPRGERI
jgi:diaminopimelate decarboxylase